MTLKYDIRNRFTGDVQFTAEIDCGDNAPDSVKVGLAVRWAVRKEENLKGTNLCGADLWGADLSGVNLMGAYLGHAILGGANLKGANLCGADLRGANIAGADFQCANLGGASFWCADLIDGGQRTDGYRFVGWVKDGVLQIRAGCHDFDITKARKHWQDKRGETPLGDETFCILDHIEAVARIRGLIGNKGDDE